MLDKDDSHDFITDIVEEIYNCADTIINNNYICRQIEPFTIWQVQEEISHVIEVTFTF